jgi:NhaC family Na+:H+ antiporter
MSNKKEKREPTFGIALAFLIIMGIFLGVGYGVYHIRAQVVLLGSALITGCLGLYFRYSWQEMEKGIVDSIHKAMPALLIMLCVGVLIGSWIACGTIPMIIYYGLKLISPQYFLLTACFVCSITSLATGTSWGTIGTLGVAFIGIALGFGIPAGPAAGAIVSGAYFGDKMSPFSDVTNLAPVVARSNLFDHIKHMLWSCIPAWLIGLFVYFLVGLRYDTKLAQPEKLMMIMKTIRENFHFHILLLMPMFIIFYFALKKKPTIPGMLLSSLLAAILAAVFQKASLTEIASAINSGYQSSTGVAEVDRLISRGGMMSMMETLLVAFAAFSFGGIMQRIGLLSIILNRVMRFVRQTWSLVLTTICSSIVSALITGNSYLSMIIPGELLSPIYRQKGLAAKNLSRIIEESGAIVVPLIPWSMAGVYVTGTIGVPVLQYVPWAIMNYAAVIILAIYGFTGFTMAPKIRDDETQIGS